LSINIDFIAHKAYQLRRLSLLQTSHAGSGHPTSCLSAADIVATLFFHIMHYNPALSNGPDNDRFILSKGHAAPLLYAAWKEVGVLTEETLMTYRSFNSSLEGHPTPRFPYFQAATGSLGMGLSIGAGMALAGNLDKRNYYTYVLMGDSEISEGSAWEAVEIAAYYKLNRLIGIVDCNGLGQSTHPMYSDNIAQRAKQFESFGWHALQVDGHNIAELIQAFLQAKNNLDAPTVIIAKTHKGYGLPAIADKEGYHGKAFTHEQLAIFLRQLEQQFPHAAHYHEKGDWYPPMPKEKESNCTVSSSSISLPLPTYTQGDKIATRKAYGQALSLLGSYVPTIVSLDAEVKNSTFAQDFEHSFPDRFFQSFIAEQNMVSMAVGFDRCNKVPFASTFGAFFSRAFDQVRMAGIGRARLRLVGSHAGVSIGQDGPSQMALEDIALMRSIPDSVVLYPCDAVSTYNLVQEMVRYEGGVSYLRTTRSDTSVIYKNDETFVIGGSKVLRHSAQDKVCVVAAGITVFEAIKAYDELLSCNIHISIIDLYSIKPLDVNTLMRAAKTSNNKMITVEDHYRAGGIGEAVTYALRNTDLHIECLAVDHMPRSGEPDELLAYEKIDSKAIVELVKHMIA
jgi:transketolase